MTLPNETFEHLKLYTKYLRPEGSKSPFVFLSGSGKSDRMSHANVTHSLTSAFKNGEVCIQLYYSILLYYHT